MYRLALHLALCLSALVAGCATRETIPDVQVRSIGGIKTGAIREHGPETLLGALNARPDVPSGVSIEVKRMQPLFNKEPRYLIAAAGELQVVSLEQQQRYDTNSHRFADDVRWWKALLAADKFPPLQRPNGQKFAEIPWMNAAHAFEAKARLRSYRWGKAILFLTTYVQGSTGAPVDNDTLVLVAQGITKDGRYAVNGRFEIRHPKLPVSTYAKRGPGKVYFMKDDEYKTGNAARWLNAQPDDSFEPSFQQYDQFLAALQIAPPPSQRSFPVGSTAR